MSKEYERRRQGARERKAALLWKIGVSALSALALAGWIVLILR